MKKKEWDGGWKEVVSFGIKIIQKGSKHIYCAQRTPNIMYIHGEG